MSIEDIYAEEIAESKRRRNEMPGENWQIFIDGVRRKQNKLALQRARERDKKKPAKKITPGKVHWLESELAKVK